jgi:ferredoxin-NADP reductase
MGGRVKTIQAYLKGDGMQVVDTKVIEVIRRTEHVMSVRLAMPQEEAFQAGQFLGVTLFSKGAELSRYLSFSSSPTEKGYIEFTKRLTESDFSQALSCLQVGDNIRIKFPLGKFVLDEACTKHAFLAGGIGITPMRSMWKGAFDQGLPVDVVLLYSNRSAEDIIFKDDFEAVAEKDKRYRVVFSLDSADKCPVDWRGRCGYINAEMIRQEIPDYKERIFYVCGPTIMVKKMVEVLKTELMIPAENIRQENISGY